MTKITHSQGQFISINGEEAMPYKGNLWESDAMKHPFKQLYDSFQARKEYLESITETGDESITPEEAKIRLQENILSLMEIFSAMQKEIKINKQ